MGRVLLAALWATASVCWCAPVRAEDEEHGDLSVSGPSALPASPEWNDPLSPVLRKAARDYRVPVEILTVLGWYGSNFENRGGVPTIEGGYGPLALRDNILGGDSLLVAAALLETDAEQLKVNPILNIRGGAAALDYFAEHAQVDRDGGLDAWWPAIVRFAGLDKDSSLYFAWQVFSTLKAGHSFTNSRGEAFSVAPQPIEIDLDSFAPPSTLGGNSGGTPQPLSPDYPPAVWNPTSCNYNAGYYAKDTVIIHTAEGSYSGTISWIKNCSAQVSAHYVVSYGGAITQMVYEDDKAWHASCYNSWSLGIEHEGFASSSSHPTAQYDASGDLTKSMCDRWGIPKQKRTTRPGIIGHVDVTHCCCGTHTDPGNGWDWTYYINRVNGGGPPPPPAFAAAYSAQSYPSSMTAGTTAVVWAEFVNQGTTSWTHCATKLGTSSPQDRTSPFCTPANWTCAGGSNPGCNRPTDVDQSSVATNAVGRFTFILTAPSTPGTYVEHFKPVQEGVTWFGPEITWTINVTAGQGNLTGTVRNGANSNPISGASVTLSSVGSTTTNGSGVYNFNNVTAGSYTVSVSAGGFSPASSGVTINDGATTTKDFNLSVTDNEPPSTPTNLVVNSTTANSVSLSWTASTDNVSVAGYDIRRDGVVINSSPTNSFTDMTVLPQTIYTYDVRAKDGATNVSGFSNAVQAITQTAQAVVFSDGFNGNLNNWTQGATAYAYSTTQNHGTLTGAGAAYMAAGTASQMYHPFTRPFAQAKVSGYFLDTTGGYHTGICGNTYRQSLSLRDNTTGTAFIVDNCMNSALPGFAAGYFWRTVGGGGVTYTNYGTRNSPANCSTPAWVYFETTVSPGAPGASPTGTFLAKVTDAAGTSTTTQNLTTDFYSFGIARVTLGLGVTSVGDGYWDDISFAATAPNVPTMGAPVASTNQIQWTFGAADNNLFGFEVANTSSTVLSPVYNAANWLTRSATSWTETGLTPNTQYSRKTRSWNGTLNSLYSSLVSAYTLSPAPVAGSVTPSATPGCPGQDVIWTAIGGFGAGHIQYYLYAFDQSPTHTFTGIEPSWSSGTLATLPSVIGSWYLHVRAYNAANVASGQFDYALPVPDTDNDGTADCNDGCPNDAGKTSPGICGCGVADIDQTSIVESGQPVDSYVAAGGTASFGVGASGTGLTYQWHIASGPLSDGVKYSGTTTATLEIANVGSGDVSAGPYHVVVTGGCGPVVTSDGADIVLATPPAITAWRSARNHGGDGDLFIALNPAATGNGMTGPAVESRQGGIRTIQIDFDQTVILVSAAALTVSGQSTVGGTLQSPVDYSSQATVTLLDDDTLQIEFPAAALPDQACYTISLAGVVKNTADQPLGGDTNCMLRSLVGDVTGSGDVSLSDSLYVKACILAGHTASYAPGLDLDLSGGALGTSDGLAAKAAIGSPPRLALCP